MKWEEAPCNVPEALRQNHGLYRVEPSDGKSLFTGYYTPRLKGSLTREGPYQFPLYAPPADLVSLPNTPETGQVGTLAWGRVEGGKLVPHVTRAEVQASALKGLGLELLYVDSEVDLFFLHVQGSGEIELPDGSIRFVAFAGKSGHPYTSIGAVLKKEENLNPAGMEEIRAWLADHPARSHEILNRNASFIFFKFADGPARGASGQVLEAEKSLAVDDTLWPYGLDVIIETIDPLTSKPFIRLMKTADCGSAIRGLARGDIYFGAGREAGKKAGRMAHPGQMWVILPDSLISESPIINSPPPLKGEVAKAWA